MVTCAAFRRDYLGTRSTTKYSYDAGRRVTEVKHPDGKTFQTVYKGRNPWKTIDEAGTQYETTYHSCCDLPTQMNGPMSHRPF